MSAFSFPLPIDGALPELLQAMHQSGQAVLQAPPGAGKTTRVPIALLEENLFSGKILMLEPRRLATRGAAARLAEHFGDELGETVGYRMRGDTKSSPKTRIEVVTEGVLTRMIQKDPELSGVSCVIFDEFHERSLNADLGLALCLEIRAELREDLALLVMSATLDAAPVASLMGNAPIVTSKGRSYPVEERFLPRPWSKPNQRGQRFEEAMASLIKTAIKDADGSILAFLPGEGEIRRVEALLATEKSKISIRPLFGAMPFADQRSAIQPTKERKLVLATSIAETSLTIEDIRIVVDGGQARRAEFDAGSGMSRLVTQRVTKAEATQRAGRAGRVAKGVCYKLWTKGENGGLIPFAAPEILTSDLTGLVLELAAWGNSEPSTLPFLTQPRETDFKAAQNLLQDLGALDDNARITALGKQIAKQPTHPRLARVLLDSGKDSALAVALMEARDVLVTGAPCDFSLRWKAAKNANRFEAETPFSINKSARRQILDAAKKFKTYGNATHSLAQMAALAYPDRIGMRRTGDAPRYLLSGGKGAFVPNGDALGAAKMLVAIDLDGQAKEAKIRKAIAITEAEITELYADQIKDVKVCEWNRRERKVLAKEQRKLGMLVLNEKNWKECDPAQRSAALIEGIKDLGISCLPWNKATELFRARISEMGDDYPDLGDDNLTTTLDDWLLPHLDGISTIEAVKKLNLIQILQNMLSWEQTDKLAKAMPDHIVVPTGTKVAVDYSGEQPMISVRIQEVFGLTVHPTVGPKKTPLLIELLSPARRAVQTTADLPNFWKTSYSDVRKDMRGRYPRHPWPEDPTEAEATRRVKNPRRS